MRPSVVTTGLLTLVMLYPWCDVVAQERTNQADTARIHVGSLGLTPTIALTNIGVDTNVFNDVESPQSDFTATITPGLEGWWRIGRARLHGMGTADAVYFRDSSNLRSFSTSGNLTMEIPANRVLPFVSIARAESRQRQGFEIDDHIHRLSTIASAGVRIDIAGKTSLEVTAYENNISFGDNAVFRGVDLQTQLNQRAGGIEGALRYQVTPMTAWVVRVERTRDRFEFSPSRDSETFRLTPGVEFNTPALINGFAYAGHRRFNVSNSEIPDFSGFVTAVDLGYTLLGRTRFSIHVDRDVAYSYDAIQPYYVLSGATAGITQRLTSVWDLSAYMTRHRLEYQTRADHPAVSARREIASSYRVETGYRVGARLRYSVRAEYFQRQIPETRELDYDGLRLGTSVAYGF